MTCDVRPRDGFGVLGTRRKFPLVSRKPVRAKPDSLVVKVAIQFHSPTQMDYSRTYNASPSLDYNNDNILTALIRRLEHCSQELLTRQDPAALEGHRGYEDEKILRYELRFTLSRPCDTPVQRIFRCFQFQTLTMDDTRDIIISTDHMIALFLRHHDSGFQWLEGPVRENFSPAFHLSRQSTSGLESISCVPQLHFVERNQAFEFVPGYMINLVFSSVSSNTHLPPWNKSLQISSRQCTPMTVSDAENLTSAISRNIQSTLDSKRHPKADIETSYSPSAVCVEFHIHNNLGPQLDHLSRSITSSQALCFDLEGKDCQELFDDLSVVLSRARDQEDYSIGKKNDIEITLTDIQHPDWNIEAPFITLLDSTTVHYRRTVEALLQRLQTGITDVLKNTSVSVGLSVYKRGHLILDKMVVAQTNNLSLTPKRRLPNEKHELVSRLKSRITLDITTVCKDTCTINQNIQMPNLKVINPIRHSSRKSSFVSRVSSVASLRTSFPETSYSPLAKASILKSHHNRTHSSTTLESLHDPIFTRLSTPSLCGDVPSPQDSILTTPSSLNFPATPRLHPPINNDDAIFLRRHSSLKIHSPKSRPTVPNSKYLEEGFIPRPFNIQPRRPTHQIPTAEFAKCPKENKIPMSKPSPRFQNVSRVLFDLGPRNQPQPVRDLDQIFDIFTPESRKPKLYRPSSISELLSAATSASISIKVDAGLEGQPESPAQDSTKPESMNDAISVTSDDEAGGIMIAQPEEVDLAPTQNKFSDKALEPETDQALVQEGVTSSTQDEHLVVPLPSIDNQTNLTHELEKPGVDLSTLREESECQYENSNGDDNEDDDEDAGVLIHKSNCTGPNATGRVPVLVSQYLSPTDISPDPNTYQRLSSNDLFPMTPLLDTPPMVILNETSVDDGDISEAIVQSGIPYGSVLEDISTSEFEVLRGEVSKAVDGLVTEVLSRSYLPDFQGSDSNSMTPIFSNLTKEKSSQVPVHPYTVHNDITSRSCLLLEDQNFPTSIASEQPDLLREKVAVSTVDTLAFLERSVAALENAIGGFEDMEPMSSTFPFMTGVLSNEGHTKELLKVASMQDLSSENLAAHDLGLSDYAIFDGSASEAESEQSSTALILLPKVKYTSSDNPSNDNMTRVNQTRSLTSEHKPTELTLARKYSTLTSTSTLPFLSPPSRPVSPQHRQFAVLTAGTLGLHGEGSTNPSLREMFMSGVSTSFHRRRSSMPWQTSNNGISPARSTSGSFLTRPLTPALLTNTPHETQVRSRRSTEKKAGQAAQSSKETVHRVGSSANSSTTEVEASKQVSTALTVQRINLNPSFGFSVSSPPASMALPGSVGLGLNTGRIRSLSSPHHPGPLGLSARSATSPTPHFYLHPSLRQHWKPSVRNLASSDSASARSQS
ncbi:hypothetical protein BROUX41_004717 [Berkeleyomyces rouxiae]